jgi:hypothetical protein
MSDVSALTQTYVIYVTFNMASDDDHTMQQLKVHMVWNYSKMAALKASINSPKKAINA